MQKKKSPLQVSASEFSWACEPDFAPPCQDSDADGRPPQASTEPRSGELKVLLESFLETLIGTVNATAGVVRLLSPDGRTLQIISSAGLSAEMQATAENLANLDCDFAGNTALAHVVRASHIDTGDLPLHPRFRSLLAATLATSNSCAPPLGILTVFFDATREAASKAMNIVAAFAEVMSASLEHTRASRDTQRGALLAERQVIANDIHDSLAQTLTYARMRVSLLLGVIDSGDELAATKYARDLDETLEIAQKSARALITDFRCDMNSGGLLAALNDLCSQFRERNRIVLDYRNRLVDLELPLEHEIQVYHIVREALTNIARHSGATHARLCVDASCGYYVFTIEDNGVGGHTFTPVEGHYGVMIMRERAHRIGAKIRLESAQGKGTQVQLFFPEPAPDWRSRNE